MSAEADRVGHSYRNGGAVNLELEQRAERDQSERVRYDHIVAVQALADASTLFRSVCLCVCEKEREREREPRAKEPDSTSD
jgi:hypothetical protein